MFSTTISTRLAPDEVALLESLGELSGSDRSSLVRALLRRGMQELRLKQAVDAFRRDVVTLSRAAEIAGLSQWDFVALMDKECLELHYGVDDFEADLVALKALP